MDPDAANTAAPVSMDIQAQNTETHMSNQERVLRVAFLAGAVTDALAIMPMLVPSVAKLLWGFEDMSGAYRFAMGYGASLMLGWTALLIWAYQRPLERRVVAALTVLVICGLMVTEVVAVVSGQLAAWRMAPTWCLQMVLSGLFAGGFHYGRLQRWAMALHLYGSIKSNMKT